MIHRVRPPDSRPKSLDLTVATSAAAKERAKVEAWIIAGRPDPQNQRPDFKAYKSDDVGPALEQLFEGKCAYCESPYASLHPVDVEHWRPKSEIEGYMGGGYEWLAMVWENLLPSCIDCNRARWQMVPDDSVPGGWRREKIGKANHFPIANPATRWTSFNLPISEVPLLLDPCVDNPAEYFDFRSDGLLLPKPDLDDVKRRRATESIRVYALNRKGLVDERRRHVLWMELEFRLIRFLYTASGSNELPQAHRDAASALVAETLDRLRERTLSKVPYSQFIARRLAKFLREELGISE